MNEVTAADRLCAVRLAVNETPEGIVLARGATTVRLTGEGAYAAIRTVLSAFDGDGNTLEGFLQQLPEVSRDAYRELLDLLVERRFLMPALRDAHRDEAIESSEDIFYWDLGRRAESVRSSLSSRSLALVGHNRVSTRLIDSLRRCGFNQLTMVDDPMLRNPRWQEEGTPVGDDSLSVGTFRERLTADSPACIIATSDIGNRAPFREWNQLAVAREIHFLPVMLRHMVGTLGPLVVPGESPCFECVRGRENSNLPDPASWRQQEAQDFENRFLAGYHPLAPEILADLAAFEVTRFYSGLGFGPVGRLVILSLLDGMMRSAKVLKLPRCPVCSERRKRPGESLGRAYKPEPVGVSSV